MRTYEVYKITNKVTNKIYIGITNQGSGARYRHHWYEARIGEPAPIHKSMAKYGEDNFTTVLLFLEMHFLVLLILFYFLLTD